MTSHYLWNLDPGYFHLRRATKTVAAILLSLCLVRHEDLLTQMMACLAAGFSMQGIVAKAFVSRVKQVIMLDSIYFLAFNLGLLVRDSGALRAFFLVLLGFFANYMRRFGLQNSVAPMMGWTLCFFATTLPFTNSLTAWQHIDALAIGLAVSALMTLVIFPDNYPRLFVNNTNHLFELLATGMKELRRETLSISNYNKFNGKNLEKIAQQLNQLLESNQAIEQSDVFIDQSYRISALLMHQYALVHVYRMMIDAYRILSRHEHQFSTQMRLTLNGLYKKCQFLFLGLRMAKDGSISSKYSAQFMTSNIKPFGEAKLDEPAMILVILNLKLSFILIEQHIALLLKGIIDEA